MKTAVECLKEQGVDYVDIYAVLDHSHTFAGDRILKAMEEYRKQGRYYSPSEISDIQNLAYEEGIKAAY